MDTSTRDTQELDFPDHGLDLEAELVFGAISRRSTKLRSLSDEMRAAVTSAHTSIMRAALSQPCRSVLIRTLSDISTRTSSDFGAPAAPGPLAHCLVLPPEPLMKHEVSTQSSSDETVFLDESVDEPPFAPRLVRRPAQYRKPAISSPASLDVSILTMVPPLFSPKPPQTSRPSKRIESAHSLCVPRGVSAGQLTPPLSARSRLSMASHSTAL